MVLTAKKHVDTVVKLTIFTLMDNVLLDVMKVIRENCEKQAGVRSGYLNVDKNTLCCCC